MKAFRYISLETLESCTLPLWFFSKRKFCVRAINKKSRSRQTSGFFFDLPFRVVGAEGVEPPTLCHSHALNSPKTNFKNSVVYLLERLRWTSYRRSVIYESKLLSSSLVRLILTKNKLQKNFIYSWRFLRYASYHQSVIYISKLLPSSLACLELP